MQRIKKEKEKYEYSIEPIRALGCTETNVTVWLRVGCASCLGSAAAPLATLMMSTASSRTSSGGGGAWCYFQGRCAPAKSSEQRGKVAPALQLVLQRRLEELTVDTSEQTSVAAVAIAQAELLIGEIDAAYNGYEFIPDHDASCDVSDRLASVQDASHLHCADEHARHENTCGGIPLVPSHCLLPGAGTFRPPASPLTISAAPLRFGGERVERPLCTTSQSFRDGGAFHNDTWRTKTGCHIAPLNPQVWISSLSAARKGPGECTRTIFFMGDSHIRNLFTATIAGLRGQATFAEGHLRNRAEKAGVLFTYRYAQKLKRDGDGHIFARDSVRVVSTEEWLSRAGRERGQHGYCDCSVEQCIIMHRIWAPLFSDQISWMKKLQLPTEPSYDLVIFSPGNSYEKDAELPGEYRGAWDALRETHTNTTFSIVHFPLGGQPEGRGEALNAWANQHARMSLFVQNLDWDVQAKYTWHFACGLATTDVHSDTVKAFAPCTDRTDTAIIRGCITLSPLFVDDGRYDG